MADTLRFGVLTLHPTLVFSSKSPWNRQRRSDDQSNHWIVLHANIYSSKVVDMLRWSRLSGYSLRVNQRDCFSLPASYRTMMFSNINKFLLTCSPALSPSVTSLTFIIFIFSYSSSYYLFVSFVVFN